MHQDPEEASNQGCEKSQEAEQPGKCELPPQFAACRRSKPNDQGDQKRTGSDQEKRQEDSVRVPAIKSLGSWNSKLVVTHLVYRVVDWGG